LVPLLGERPEPATHVHRTSHQAQAGLGARNLGLPSKSGGCAPSRVIPVRVTAPRGSAALARAKPPTPELIGRAELSTTHFHITYDASPYPYWITFRGMTERYGAGTAGGAEQVMQDFWELTSQNAKSNQEAIAAALGLRGTTLADGFHDYAVAAKFNRPCAGGYAYPYCFEEGAGYVSIAGATSVHATVASVGGSATASVEDNHALRYRGRLAGRMLPPGRYRLLVRARDAAGNLSSRQRAAFWIVR
jgi:hypothetical protein